MSARTAPGLLELRDAPAGLPDSDLRPPVFAESGDPFAAARIVDLLARIERGRPVRVLGVMQVFFNRPCRTELRRFSGGAWLKRG